MGKEPEPGKTAEGKKKKEAPQEHRDGKDREQPRGSPGEEAADAEAGRDTDARPGAGAESAGRALEAKVEELSRENEELLGDLKRLKAEFENYRKRMLKEQTYILETAEAELVKKLLTVIDNLERALESARADESSKRLREGVEMVLEQMMQILGGEGLEVIDPRGESFDPEHHEAMMVIETDECPEDTVVDVAQKGYRFKGRLLRPAMVHVSCPVRSAQG